MGGVLSKLGAGRLPPTLTLPLKGGEDAIEGKGNSAITLTGLAKTYRLFRSPRHRLWQMLIGEWRRYYTTHEALKPLTVTIRRGETVGLIGRNGSGKSTLLQLLAGTLSPSAGSVAVQGRIAALLELSAGFNPQFTGRENVFLNASILGIPAEEMARRYDEIAAFANIGDFIDRPVSTYSSGMVVRLAFAVATAVQPDILIVDEALSVGDEAFQRKCFSRIEAMREAGTTVLFVSHSAQMVLQLCDRVLWLDRGELLMDGEPKAVMDRYHQLMHAPAEQQEMLRTRLLERRDDAVTPGGDLVRSESCLEYPPDGAHITDIVLTDDDSAPIMQLEQGAAYRLRYRVTFDRAVEQVKCGLLIKTASGLEASGAVVHLNERGHTGFAAGDSATVIFRFRCLLYPQRYFFNCGVVEQVGEQERYLHRLIDAFEVTVTNPPMRNEHGVQAGGVTDLDYDVELVVTDANSSQHG